MSTETRATTPSLSANALCLGEKGTPPSIASRFCDDMAWESTDLSENKLRAGALEPLPADYELVM